MGFRHGKEKQCSVCGLRRDCNNVCVAVAKHWGFVPGDVPFYLK